MKIKAAVVNGVGEDYQIEDLELAEMQPDEIIVKIVASGMCMSDETETVGHQYQCRSY